MSPRPRLVGVNHVALEVGDVDEALAFYGAIFDLTLRGRAGRMAFVDMGDQFIALGEGRTQTPDDHRHLGLVVDDKEATRRALEEAGAEILRAAGSTSATPGATGSRSSTTATCSSRRPRTSSGGWGSKASRRASAPWPSSARRASAPPSRVGRADRALGRGRPVAARTDALRPGDDAAPRRPREAREDRRAPGEVRAAGLRAVQDRARADRPRRRLGRVLGAHLAGRGGLRDRLVGAAGLPGTRNAARDRPGARGRPLGGKHRFVHAFPSVDNAPSNAICRKAGFTLLGERDFEYPPGHPLRSNDWRFDLSA